MEIDLTSVNSGLVDMIESQLLETELHVNDDEDIVMADDLLDLELNTMSLSQFTRPDTVFRVLYKKMHDSQTSNSRLSSQLCCKDQIRSNNNSTLLDATHSSSYEEAWGPRGSQQTCQVCHEELPSHQALRLHMNAQIFYCTSVRVGFTTSIHIPSPHIGWIVLRAKAT